MSTSTSSLYVPCIPSSAEYQKEAELATAAVLRACYITQKVQKAIKKVATEEKPDKSPVTVADYASQALLSHLLSLSFPLDPLVGEEDTTTLRSSSLQATTMRASIVELVNEALALEGNGVGEKLERLNEEQVLEAIDRGRSEGGREGRWWTCDPIDGTLGFLRGEQYAICLTLLSSSLPVLALIACPNLPFPSLSHPTPSLGTLFLATTSSGSHQLPLSSPCSSSGFLPIHLPPSPTPPYAILESVEASHSSHSINAAIATSLGGFGERIRMDSQAKYGALARGDASLYLRVPTRFSGGMVYEEKVWDHASGWLLVKEAGGEVGDCWGEGLDFGRGRTLKGNDGVIASAKNLNPKALQAVRAAILEANPELSPPA